MRSKELFRKVLKIKDSVDLDILKKFGFKLVQQNEKFNYIYFPENTLCSKGNSITVYNDANLYNLNSHIGEDRIIKFRLDDCLTYDFNKTMVTLFNMIKADLIEVADFNELVNRRKNK